MSYSTLLIKFKRTFIFEILSKDRGAQQARFLSEIKTLWVLPRYILVSLFIVLLFLVTRTEAYSGMNFPNWSQKIVLRDYFRVCDFPAELLSYEVEFPGTFPSEHLRLIGPGGETLPYQLSGVEQDMAGNILRATLSFRSGLKAGQTKRFEIAYDPDYNSVFEDRVVVDSTSGPAGTATIGGERQMIRVPYGKISNPTAADAPIKAISQDEGQTWIGEGRFTGPVPSSLETEVVEDGPLFATYRISYGNGYEVTLTVEAGERFVAVEEKLPGGVCQTAFRFSYTDGVDPTGRLTYNKNGMYSSSGRLGYTGAYDDRLQEGGELPYQVGLFDGQVREATIATTFFSNDTESAIMFSTNRPDEWDLHEYYSWESMEGKPELLHFYQEGGEKYMEAQLAGQRRYWAMGVIPRDSVTIEGLAKREYGEPETHYVTGPDDPFFDQERGDQAGRGPEIRLMYERLTYQSLDWIKDMTFDWNESLDGWEGTLVAERHGLIEGIGATSYESFFLSGNGSADFKRSVYALLYRGVRALVGGSLLNGPEWFATYMNSRSGWTEAQRVQIRALLVWFANIIESGYNYQYRSAMGGNANFVIEEKRALGLAAAAFPNHPRAEDWKESYLTFFEKWLEVYVRKGYPQYNTRAGRFTENVGNYLPASFYRAENAASGLYQYDGTEVFALPQARDWLEWMIHLMAPSAYGYYLLLPQGDHSRRMHEYTGLASQPGAVSGEAGALTLGADVVEHTGAPKLGMELKWMATGGGEGIKPELESALYEDYGAILRYHFGQEDEAYLHLQQLNGRGYRWNRPNSGQTYYGTHHARWSWNINYDEIRADDQLSRATSLPIFSLEGKFLSSSPTDEILYNFGFAQFYRLEAPSGNGYQSRAALMVRNDFISLYDDLEDASQDGLFNWVNEETHERGEHRQVEEGRPHLYEVKGGPGDELHLVSPGDQPELEGVQATPFGAVVKGDPDTDRDNRYVLMLDEKGRFEDGPVFFQGKTGYAEAGAVALFEGSRIIFGALDIEIDGDFGVSARRQETAIRGRIAGRSGGTITVRLPEVKHGEDVAVRVDGHKVEHVLENKRIVRFEVSISQEEGYKPYAVTILASNRR